MRYALIAVDMDGTLLGESYTISERNKRAVAGALALGARVVPCSGRSYASLRAFARELALPMGSWVISLNGGALHQLGSDEAVFEAPLRADTARRVLRLARGYTGDAVVYRDSFHTMIAAETELTARYVETSGTAAAAVGDLEAAVQSDVAKILVLGENAELTRLGRDARAASGGGYDVVFSSPGLVEFMPPGVSKGAALRALCGRLCIDMGAVIAIGDNENDLTMLEAAGLGAAMRNATAEAQARADYITERDCFHDGVAEVIEKFVLTGGR